MAYAFVGCDVIKKKLEELDSLCEPEGAAKCSKDNQAFLRCKSKHLEPELECRGDRHCYQEGSKVHCDQSKGEVTDRCDSTGAACSLDGKHRLNCKDGALTFGSDCIGPKGCYVDDGKAICDQPDFPVEFPCLQEGSAVCGKSGRALLECKSGKFLISKDCLGTKGCQYTEHNEKVLCDTTKGAVGGACAEGASCSVDGKHLLTCVANVFVEEAECPGAEGCHMLADNRLQCADAISDVGVPCGTASMCSRDRAAVLRCEASKLVVAEKCAAPRRCSLTAKGPACGGP